MRKLVFILTVLILYANFAYAEIFSENSANGCSFNENPAALTAMFEPTQYVCSTGYYLPANIDGCRACLAGHTCSGGTFRFNKNIDQGIVYALPIVENVESGCARDLLYNGNLWAEFIRNEHTCSAGQYLPAGVDSCAPCPANSYCLGGTYSFNETTDQGIESCANGYSSTAGSSSCTANTITVRWDDGNGGAYTTTCTYGGTLTTPTTPPVAPKGYHFTGWTFDLGN